MNAKQIAIVAGITVAVVGAVTGTVIGVKHLIKKSKASKAAKEENENTDSQQEQTEEEMIQNINTKINNIDEAMHRVYPAADTYMNQFEGQMAAQQMTMQQAQAQAAANNVPYSQMPNPALDPEFQRQLHQQYHQTPVQQPMEDVPYSQMPNPALNPGWKPDGSAGIYKAPSYEEGIITDF